MADVSVTHTMFFVASVIVAASLAGVFVGISNEMAKSISDEADRLDELADSEFAVLNDPAMVPYSGGVLTIYLKNLSSRMMRGQVDVFVDGTLVTECTFTLQGAGGQWAPGTVMTVNITKALGQGDHNLRLVLDNGVDQELRFRI